ncbi:MAG TPA: hypothetical protein V6C96_01300, partial [Vampirovibrionales bacterium]
MIKSEVGNTETVLDLTKLKNWKETKAELQKILKNKTFWSNSNLTIRLADFCLSDEEIAELIETLNIPAISITELQTNSLESLQKLNNHNIKATPINSAREERQTSSSKMRLLREVHQTSSEELSGLKQDMEPTSNIKPAFKSTHNSTPNL